VIDIKEVYDKYIADKNEANRQKIYVGNEKWFHASSAGMCMRKHYFKNVAGVKPSPIDDNTMRLFRMGDMVHEDIQDALTEYAQLNGAKIYIEKEIQLPEVNVRGFLDVLIADDGALYDIKTCNSRKWSKLFGYKYKEPNASLGYHLQLGTYAWWYEKETNTRLKKLALFFYNKDTSRVRELSVDLSFIEEAKAYWKDLNKRFKKGNPAIEIGVAPMYSWECNKLYCNFWKVCGGGLKGEGEIQL
jgi:CRISPR/Cas system-associated exonuclease Cas4 (RecB family)